MTSNDVIRKGANIGEDFYILNTEITDVQISPYKKKK